MKKFDLLNDLTEFSNHWTISGFQNAYPDSKAHRNCAIATLYADISADETTLVIFRTFLENDLQLKVAQKYVIALRFYGFGNIATLDLISMDVRRHAEIVNEHINRLDAPHGRDAINPYNGDSQIPYLIAGGWVQKNSNNKLVFNSRSLDYGASMFFADSNSIASYVAQSCGLKVDSTMNIQKGEYFFMNILDFMLKTKDSPDFYEKFATKALYEETEKKGFNAQQITALMMMKVVDRHLNEGRDMIRLIVDEMTEGFGRRFMLESIAASMQRSDN